MSYPAGKAGPSNDATSREPPIRLNQALALVVISLILAAYPDMLPLGK